MNPLVAECHLALHLDVPEPDVTEAMFPILLPRSNYDVCNVTGKQVSDVYNLIDKRLVDPKERIGVRPPRQLANQTFDMRGMRKGLKPCTLARTPCTLVNAPNGRA
jgi:hypothetical protein